MKLKLNKETISRLNNDEMGAMGASGNVCFTVARTCICFVERTGMVACGFENPKTMPCRLFTWHTDQTAWQTQTETRIVLEHGDPDPWGR